MAKLEKMKADAQWNKDLRDQRLVEFMARDEKEKDANPPSKGDDAKFLRFVFFLSFSLARKGRALTKILFTHSLLFFFFLLFLSFSHIPRDARKSAYNSDNHTLEDRVRRNIHSIQKTEVAKEQR